MIRYFLITNPGYQLRVNIGQGFQVNNNPMQFYFSNRTAPNNHLYVDHNNQNDVLWAQNAYCLPWNRDAGLYLDIPEIDQAATLFLTSQLTGCYLGVQRLNNVIRLRHWNGDLTEDDLRRYGDIAWLIPQGHGLMNVGSHVHFYQNPTCFWGEFENGSWKFYYQTSNGAIHPFYY